MTKDTSDVVARLLARTTAGQWSDTVGADPLCAEAAALISSLVAENESLTTKVGHAQYAMDTVARFVRPRIPSDQNPEQATNFLAWIGMILRLEQRAEVAERQHIEAERLLAEARAVITEIADFDPDGPIDPDTVRLIRIAGAYRRASIGGGNG